jgi:hypothetical protein
MQMLAYGTLLSGDAVLAGQNMDLRPGNDGSGLVAFLMVAGLVLVCVFLYRSMRTQLRNIDVDRFNPPEPGRTPGSEPPATTSESGSVGGSAGSEPA